MHNPPFTSTGVKKQTIYYGCHNFLNALPLVYPLLNNVIKHNFNIILDSPANLVARLKKRELDISFIPSISYAVLQDVVLIPDYSISSNGSVDSVLLFSKGKRLDEIEKILVDDRSRTSVVLLKIIFKELFNRDIKTLPFSAVDIDFNNDIGEDAGLIIGDRAFLLINNNMYKEGYNIYDLSTLWYNLTNLPFVHAVLAVRKGLFLDKGLPFLYTARRLGMELVGCIVKEASINLGLTEAYCTEYLTRKISYHLGEKELIALRHFYTLAKRYNFIEWNNEIEFYHI